MDYNDENPPKVHDRVKIGAGLYNGRVGEVREIDTPNKRVRVHAPGLMSQETVLLRWSEISKP